MSGRRSLDFFLNRKDAGSRLDTAVASRFPDTSRSIISRLIREGMIRVDGRISKPGQRAAEGSRVTGTIPGPESEYPRMLLPEPLPLNILFEDDFCLVLNKPPGIVVHPSPGHYGRTLANALIFHRPELKGVGYGPDRPGIIHRLDKDTSGVLLAAKTSPAFSDISSQFKARCVEKTYLGLVYGSPEQDSGEIDSPIGRHREHRKKMSAVSFSKARPAETHWRVIGRYGRLSLLQYTIKTGRTHQIRVHSASISCPIAGDSLYGIKKPEKFLKDSKRLLRIIRGINRQMLHAWRIRFTHPETGSEMIVEAPLAEDMKSVIKELDPDLDFNATPSA